MPQLFITFNHYIMDPAFIQAYFDNCDKRAIRKIITAAVKAKELPVTIRPVIPRLNPNKNTNKRKASAGS